MRGKSKELYALVCNTGRRNFIKQSRFREVVDVLFFSPFLGSKEEGRCSEHWYIH